MAICDNIIGIETTICNCERIRSPQDLLEFSRASGMRFIDPRPGNADRVDKNPKSKFTEDGSVYPIPLHFTFQELGRDTRAMSAGWQLAVANLRYHAAQRAICIFQVNSPNSEYLQEMVHGQLALLRILAPAIGATYGWIDVPSDNALPRVISKFSEVKNWFYANLLGPGIVQDAPQSFFDNLPLYEKTTVKDGGILVRSSKTIAEWYESPKHELAVYLAKHAPWISIHQGI